MPGVVSGHGGRAGLAFVNDGGERLQGVIATTLPDGRVGLELHLATELVPLPPLGDTVRTAVAGAVASAGLADRLGPVDVRFEDVLEPGEATTRAPA